MRGYDLAVLNELLLQLLTIIYSENSSILNYLFEEYFSGSVFELLDRCAAEQMIRFVCFLLPQQQKGTLPEHVRVGPWHLPDILWDVHPYTKSP